MNTVLRYIFFETKRLNSKVFDEHESKIEDFEIRMRDIKDDLMHTRVKAETIENSLPTMIREMIEFYCDQKITPLLEKFLEKSSFKQAMSLKMDNIVFETYVRK